MLDSYSHVGMIRRRELTRVQKGRKTLGPSLCNWMTSEHVVALDSNANSWKALGRSRSLNDISRLSASKDVPGCLQ